MAKDKTENKDEKGFATLGEIETLIKDSLPGMVKSAINELVKSDEKDVTEPPVENLGHVIRNRKFTIESKDKGIAAARLVRAMAWGKGDPGRAKHFIEKSYNDALGDEIQKALTSAEFGSGGALVLPEYASEIIELLRARTVIRSAGPRTLPMNNGTLTIRKQTAGSSASYVGESQNIGVTQPETGQITLTAKKLAAIVPISNDLLTFTSSPSADEFVRDDLVMEMAIREDRAFIRDDGTQDTPKGLRHWALNVIATNGTTSADIEEDFKDFINTLELADVRMVRPVWFMNPRSRNHLRNLRDPNGNLIYPEVRGNQPTLYGWPIMVTTSIPANLGVGGNETEIYLVDMVDVIIGESTDLMLAVDSSAAYVENNVVKSAFSLDETLIRAIARHDFAVRHRESVVVMSDIVWGA